MSIETLLWFLVGWFVLSLAIGIPLGRYLNRQSKQYPVVVPRVPQQRGGEHERLQ